MATWYAFDNARPEAGRGFASLEAAYDAWTIGQLEGIGVSAGWRCLEVGGGGGSISRWLATRAGEEGKVTVTDIDPSWVARAPAPNLVIMRHDIGVDPLPERAFDLVHARLVLMHVPGRDAALRRMVSALAPGGWLLVEDFDMRVFRNGEADSMVRTRLSDAVGAEDVELLTRVDTAFVRLLVERGVDTAYGRRLYGLLCAEGLQDVIAEGYMAIAPGSTLGATQRLSRYRLLRDELVAAGGITADELDRACALLERPDCPVLTSGILVSARGRRP
jgi:SAM-dependent methyltransferase